MKLFLAFLFVASSLLAYDDNNYVAEINSVRARYKLSPVSYDKSLSQVAKKWSDYLISRNLFDHRSDLKSFLIKYNTITENLFKSNIAPSPKLVINSWMNSSGHRENLLDKDTTIVGIGISSKKGIYIVVYNGADL